MQAEFQIRPLVASDYAAVLALWRKCDGVEIAEGDDEESFRAYLKRNPDLSCCAEASGAIVAAALCGHDGRRGLIYHLAVDPAHRGRGIGKEIVRAGVAGLRRAGIARAIVLVSKGNASGLGFWSAHGFGGIPEALPLGIDL